MNQHYLLEFNHLPSQHVETIGQNTHVPNNKRLAKACFKRLLKGIGFLKGLEIVTFKSKFGHGFGFRICLDDRRYIFEGKSLRVSP